MTDFKKTLILDFSNIAYATYYILLGKKDEELREPEAKFAYWRYMMLNSIKKNKIKHQPTEFIIAVDSMSWRKKAFKYYKAKRDELKKEADFDFQFFIEHMKEFVEEIKENFHYKVIQQHMAEADDIIGILVNELKDKRDKVIIASNDKDFKQLVKGNVHLWNIREEKFIQVENAREYLISHILKGDSGDGIPNVRSDDDVFITDGKRQKPCGPKLISKILENGLEEYIQENELTRNFARNRKLIELSKRSIPSSVWKRVMIQYESIEDKKANFTQILTYLGKHQLRNLMKEVNLFI